MLQITPTAGNNKRQLGPGSPFRIIILVTGFINPLKNKLIDPVPGNASHSNTELEQFFAEAGLLEQVFMSASNVKAICHYWHFDASACFFTVKIAR